MLRPLHQTEQLQLAICKNHHQKVLAKKFNWVLLILLLALEICFIILIAEGTDHWFIFLLTIAIPIILWSNISGYLSDRKHAKKLLSFVSDIEQQASIDVQIYESDQALLINITESEELLFLLQIAPQQSIAFLEYPYDPAISLPNTKFEVYKSDKVAQILGKDYTVLGEHFQPIKIDGVIETETDIPFPQNKQIINHSIESYLKYLEQKTKP